MRLAYGGANEFFSSLLESLIELAVETDREGREGRRVGTLFILGDESAVATQVDVPLGFGSRRHIA